MKNTLDGINDKLDITDEEVSEFAARAIQCQKQKSVSCETTSSCLIYM